MLVISTLCPPIRTLFRTAVAVNAGVLRQAAQCRDVTYRNNCVLSTIPLAVLVRNSSFRDVAGV